MKKFWSRFSARETAFLLLPVALIFGALLWFKIRPARPPFIVSQNPIHAAFWSGNGEIVSIGRPAPSPGARHSSIPIFARWNAKTGEQIAEVRADGILGRVALSPDGKWLVSLVWDGKRFSLLTVRDVKNGFFISNSIPVNFIRRLPAIVWKRDSSGVFLLHVQSASFWNIQSQNLTPLPLWNRVFPGEIPEGAVFSPDKKWVAFERRSRELFRSDFNYSAPNSKISLGSVGAEIRVCSWPNLKPLATLPGDGFRAPQFSSDGKNLLALALFRDKSTTVAAYLARFDLATCKTTFSRLQGDVETMRSLELGSFSPDGRVFVSSATNADGFSFYATDSARLLGQKQISLKDPNRGAYFAHFSPDSRRLLTVTSGGIEILDVPVKTAN